MTPAMVIELEAVDGFPTAPADFSPTDEWVHTYRVWTCHGYRESGNENVGFLKISRAAGSGNGFTLHVEQQLVHSEAALHTMRAEIECRPDAIASTARWPLSSSHTSPDGNVQKDLSVREQGSVTGATLTVTINGRTSARKVGGATTADWCLFEAVQRLPFDKSVSLKLDVLEGLSILRPGHRLSYRGAPVGQPGLHGFQQLGEGLLPYGYWLNDRRQLVMVSAGGRVYLLDDEAEAITAKDLAGSRKYYEQKRQARRR
jgi:hypothetical protein